MIKHNQDGAANGLLISLIMTVILLLAAIGFGAWSYSSRQDYKDNSDAKADTAAKAAAAQESTIKDKQFAEESKNPLKTYNGPEALGSLVIKYPKTWSGYLDNSGNGEAVLGIYFNPDIVPSVSAQNAVFALHVKIVSKPYASALEDFKSQQQNSQTPTTISAYALPKLPKVVGVKVTGAISDQTDGVVVVLPLRSQTLEIETDGTQYVKDFNNNILPNFSFSP